MLSPGARAQSGREQRPDEPGRGPLGYRTVRRGARDPARGGPDRARRSRPRAEPGHDAGPDGAMERGHRLLRPGPGDAARTMPRCTAIADMAGSTWATSRAAGRSTSGGSNAAGTSDVRSIARAGRGRSLKVVRSCSMPSRAWAIRCNSSATRPWSRSAAAWFSSCRTRSCSASSRAVPVSNVAFDGTTVMPNCHVHASLMSLPAILRTTLDSVPNRVPYLPTEPIVVDRWRKALAAELAARPLEDSMRRAGPSPARATRPFLVGVVWQGSPGNPMDHFRSFPLAESRAGGRRAWRAVRPLAGHRRPRPDPGARRAVLDAITWIASGRAISSTPRRSSACSTS